MQPTRSDRVYSALKTEPNRFQVCRLASKGARRLHYPGERIADSMNLALRFIAQGKNKA